MHTAGPSNEGNFIGPQDDGPAGMLHALGMENAHQIVKQRRCQLGRTIMALALTSSIAVRVAWQYE